MKIVVNDPKKEVNYVPLTTFNQEENYGKAYRDTHGDLYVQVSANQYISVSMIGGGITVFDTQNSYQDENIINDIKVIETPLTATLTIE